MKKARFLFLSIGKGICISIVSAIVFLALFELGLRIAGHLYFSARMGPGESIGVFKKEKEDYVILCVGDSFTFGGELARQYTYPAQLQSLFRERDPGLRARVINGGVCEHNSSQVLSGIPLQIRRYKPEVIVLLVGSANRFNFVGLHKQDKNSAYAKTKDFIYNLRIYRVFKITALNLRLKILKFKLARQKGKILTDDTLKQKSLVFALMPEVSMEERTAEANYRLVMYLYSLGKYNDASRLYDKYTRDERDLDLLAYHLSLFTEDIYRYRNLSLEEKIDNYQEALSRDPVSNDSPWLSVNLRLLKQMRNEYSEEIIDKWRRDDLDKIISLCVNNGVRVIIQQYPFPYPDADRALSDMAAKYSLPLVKNSEVFSVLLRKEDRKKYFLDDSHCTMEGYGVMAENLYGVIKANLLFKEDPDGRQKEQ